MISPLSPQRIDELIEGAVRRGDRTKAARIGAVATVCVVAIAALVGLTSTLLGGPGTAVPAQPTPSLTTTDTSPTPTPEPVPTPTAADFASSYTPDEQQMFLRVIGMIAEDQDPSMLSATVSRIAWGDGIAMLAPDLSGSNSMAPAYVLRVTGPLSFTRTVLVRESGVMDAQSSEDHPVEPELETDLAVIDLSSGLGNLQPEPTSPLAGTYPTQWPPAPAAAFVDFETAYTDGERALVLEGISRALNGQGGEQFWAVISRSTHADGLRALSPDVDMGADDTPALILRIGGPISPYSEHASGAQSVRGEPGQWAATVATISLFGLDGQGFMGSEYLLTENGDMPEVPAIDSALEHDAALVPMDLVPVHEPEPSVLPIEPEDAARADAMIKAFSDALPAPWTLTQSDYQAGWHPDGPRAPRGFRFTINDGERMARGSLALWHLAGDIAGPDCEPGGDGCVKVDRVNDAWIEYTYIRDDRAAIYLPMPVVEGDGPAFSHEEMSDLLTDPGFTPYLDWIKEQPAE